jgi:hypothetical protein
MEHEGGSQDWNYGRRKKLREETFLVIDHHQNMLVADISRAV